MSFLTINFHTACGEKYIIKMNQIQYVKFEYLHSFIEIHFSEGKIEGFLDETSVNLKSFFYSIRQGKEFQIELYGDILLDSQKLFIHIPEPF